MHYHLHVSFTKWAKDAKAPLNETRKPSDHFAYQTKKKNIHGVLFKHDVHRRSCSKNSGRAELPCKGACTSRCLLTRNVFLPFTRACSSTSLLKESKMQSTHNPSLQPPLQQKNILLRPLYTPVLHTVLGTAWYREKRGKQALCLTFLTDKNMLLYTVQEWRCQNEVNIVLNRQIPLGSSFRTSLESRVVWIKPRLKYTMQKVQQWPLTSCSNYSSLFAASAVSPSTLSPRMRTLKNCWAHSPLNKPNSALKVRASAKAF